MILGESSESNANRGAESSNDSSLRDESLDSPKQSTTDSSLREFAKANSWQSKTINRASAQPNLARFVVQKIGIKDAVVPSADFLLESDKRGTPPKSEKRQLLARRRSGAWGAALLRKEKGESGSRRIVSDSQVAKMDCHDFATQNLAMTEIIANSAKTHNDK